MTIYLGSIKDSNPGYSGTGYADMGGEGSYVQFTVAAPASGTCILSFRYAQGGSSTRPASVKVNGIGVGSVLFAQTPSWSDWLDDAIVTTCSSGTNTVRITATSGAGGPNVDGMSYQAGAVSEGSDVTDYVVPGTRYVTIPSGWSGLHVIGKLGDYVDVGEDSSPPAPLDDASVQASFRSLIYNPLGGPVLICGSPDEVASDPFNGDQGFDVSSRLSPRTRGYPS